MSVNNTDYTSMSITSLGASTLHNQKLVQGPFEIKKTNNVSDIEGTKSFNKYDTFVNKPVFSNADVDGATPKSRTHIRNVRDNQLYIDDIEGSRYTVKDRMMKTGRHTNPLTPNYPAPAYIPADPQPTKFIRDSMNIDDIEGSRTKPAKNYEQRDNLNTSDIIGAQASWKPRHSRVRLDAAPHDIMDTSASTKSGRYIDRTSRSMDNMNPHYTVYGTEIRDDPKFCKPKQQKAYIADNNQLQTRDIPGAYSGWKTRERTELRNLTSTMDIQGAQADTIIHNIITTREINPNQPVYQSLDGGNQMLHNLNEPLMPPRLITTPTLKPFSSKKQEPKPEKLGNSNKSTKNIITHQPLYGYNVAAVTGTLQPKVNPNTLNIINHQPIRTIPRSPNPETNNAYVPVSSATSYANKDVNSSSFINNDNNTGSNNSFNFNEFDPVLFSGNDTTSNKPPVYGGNTGNMKLDLGASYNTSGANSATEINFGNNSRSNSGGRLSAGGQNVVGFAGFSPMSSARNKQMVSPKERKATTELNNEINAVRGLM
jgi:hypothetical protein